MSPTPEASVTTNQALSASTESVPAEPVTEPVTEPVVYHTISGGPETLKEMKDRNAPEVVEHMTSVINSTPAAEYTASGYSVPQTNITAMVPEEHTSSFGFTIFTFLIIMALGVYVYFLMPERFQQAATLFLSLKDSLFAR